MNKQLINKDDELIVMRERQQMLSPTYWNPVVETSLDTEKTYGLAMKNAYMIFNDGKVMLVVVKNDWDNIAETISEKIVSNETFFQSIEEKTNFAKQEIENFVTLNKEKAIESLDFDSLIVLANEVKELFIKFDAASLFAWFVAGDLVGSKIQNILQISKEDLEIISTPDDKAIVSQMEESILRLSLDNNLDIVSASNELAEKYYWVPFGYDGPVVWDKEYFENLIKHKISNKENSRNELDLIIKNDREVADKKAQVYQKIGQLKDRQIHILRSITKWTDERKSLDFRLFNIYYKILISISKITEVEIRNLKYLFTHELKDLLSNKDYLISESNKRIDNEFVVCADKFSINILSNDDRLIFKRLIYKQNSNSSLKGIVASKGDSKIYRAKVKVLFDAKECLKIEDGDILVAPMTTPDYISGMKKAIGFITDEGGITCHAAIVSREMKKPCIISTKNATKVLKDGDIVEMNVDDGTIKKID